MVTVRRLPHCDAGVYLLAFFDIDEESRRGQRARQLRRGADEDVAI